MNDEVLVRGVPWRELDTNLIGFFRPGSKARRRPWLLGKADAETEPGGPVRGLTGHLRGDFVLGLRPVFPGGIEESLFQ